MIETKYAKTFFAILGIMRETKENFQLASNVFLLLSSDNNPKLNFCFWYSDCYSLFGYLGQFCNNYLFLLKEQE